jgi:hypothetical protein
MARLRIHLNLASAFVLAAAGCARAPDLAVAAPVAGPPPAILPIDQLIAEAEALGAAAPPDAALAARAAALRQRADAL